MQQGADFNGRPKLVLGRVDRALPADRRLARLLLTGNKWRESEKENLDGSQG